MYLIEKSIKEAFQAGSAIKVITKISNILNKRLGKPVAITSVPLAYQNSDGKFQGFMGYVSGLDRLFRVNFELTSSDTIVSMDLYNGDPGKPLITVRFDNMNIIQIIESMVLELESTVVDKSIFEAQMKEYTSEERKQKLFNAWLKEEKDSLDLLQNKALQSVYTLFLKKDKYNSDVNLPSFTTMAKQYLFGLGLTNPTFRARKKGSPEKEVVDKALEDKFQDIVENMSWVEKFEFLRGTLTQMYKGLVNSIYIYGNPETGKSFEVKQTLEKLNADYKLYKGDVIKSKDDLIRILYNNREGKILVFDDADKVLTIDPNIWKTVLENVKVRTLTTVDVNRFKNKNMADIPPQFDFESGVIFISNNYKLNSAVASRSMVMNVKLSNEEALAKVESTIKAFLPDVDMKIKKEAIAYAKEISNGVKNMGYRTVETIIIAMQISPENWKKQAIWLLSSR